MGLIEKWKDQYQPKPIKKCLAWNQKGQFSRLSIANLSGAFVILLIGYLVSLFISIFENAFTCCVAQRAESILAVLLEVEIVHTE